MPRYIEKKVDPREAVLERARRPVAAPAPAVEKVVEKVVERVVDSSPAVVAALAEMTSALRELKQPSAPQEKQQMTLDFKVITRDANGRVVQFTTTERAV